ncbi:MAG TPA: right-handed parallel beta-helix repeat-containing protein [Anaerohalosphaeraceae bacterium]|nr:right-handed parallel beta-helix repeat-containing protein [Anaerohalosphaeraceae bacterium]HRT52185.1 right-handed parallel beta-helix repeat-containing protein [Anaerohalosphaeraceae bacterium]HRT87181.1 right-handed parallel beta-helix repeat-containing protein [Anaerohalosphaeraceae bacterium]
MTKIGLTYTLRNSSNPITLDDLISHDVLIVGWSVGGDRSGLNPAIIEQGITGRVILSGHDSDYHVVHGPSYADTLFVQEIEYVLQGGGTGLIVCADVDDSFSWLPESWGVTAQVLGGEIIKEITQDGIDSGVYDGLTPQNLSGWQTAYHNVFEYTGTAFRTLEVDNEYRAVTIATPWNALGVEFWKYDDSEGQHLMPGDQILYTIEWNNTSGHTLYNVKIIDHLPEGVTYPWPLDPNTMFDLNYSYKDHTYTWMLGDLYPDDSGQVTLTALVNERAEPGLTLENIATMTADGVIVGWASIKTKVCCWDTVDPNIIYVDETATGYNNGTNWQDAYVDLQSALTRARDVVPVEIGPYTIYVAQGTYSPGDYVKNTFELPDGLSMYGGFKTGGCDFIDRNPDRYRTILTGYIGLDENEEIVRNEAVVMMGNDTVLDSFVIQQGSYYGVYGMNVSFAVTYCVLADNQQYGLFAVGGGVVLRSCTIKGNGYNGIYHEGQPYVIAIDNCELLQNGRSAVFSQDSTPQIRNSTVCGNGFSAVGYPGVRIIAPESVPTLLNNSIAYNRRTGISFADNDPNAWEWDYPDIQNCILWYNNDDGDQMAGCAGTQYSCVFDPNHADGTDYTLDAYGNFSGNPGFAYEYSDDPNVILNVHLAYDSPCTDMGSDLLPYSEQLDIDGEERVIGDYVDIGADEVYSCDDDLTEDDISNPVDWTADGIVNFNEYCIFAEAWLSVDPNNPLCDPNNPNYVSDPNDPNYISEDDKLRYRAKCDLDTDLDVDLADLSLFSDEWLWMACWREAQAYRFDLMAMAMGGGESMMMAVPFAKTFSTALTEPETALAESDLARLVHGVYEIMAFVDETIAEDPANSASLLEMKASLAEILLELYYENNPQ